MAVIKEFECMAHGYFEGTEPVCPEGCSGEAMVRRVFLTAPSIQSTGYNNINDTFESLAEEHGLSNMSNRGGDGMRKADYATHKRLNQVTEMISPNGTDVNQYFGDIRSRAGLSVSSTARPVDEVVNPLADTRGMNGAIYRDQMTGAIAVGDGINLLKPKVRLEAPGFNGSDSGLPAGEK
jgi:hypothetical protein